MSMTDESSAGPSPWDRQLHAHLRGHVETERAILEKYAEVAERTDSKAFRYLVNLLIDEEVRHHRHFNEMADSLETQALMKREEPDIPYMDFHRADRAAVLEGAKELLENEERDIGELKRLQRDFARPERHNAVGTPGGANGARHRETHCDPEVRTRSHLIIQKKSSPNARRPVIRPDPEVPCPQTRRSGVWVGRHHPPHIIERPEERWVPVAVDWPLPSPRFG